MEIVLLLVAGIATNFDVGDPCVEALHQLRVEERMQIEATDVLEDNVLAFTLGDGGRLRGHLTSQKTAILVCERVEDVVDSVPDDPEPADDMTDDEPEPTEEELGPTDDLGDEEEVAPQ